MEITKNKTADFVLVNVVLPIVLSLVVAYAYDKIKARNEAKTKSASKPPQVAPVATEDEVTQTEIV